MDKALYVAMTGARASLQAQGTVSHNIANTDTPGFKEALANTEAFAIRGQGFASRVDAIHVDAGFNRRVASAVQKMKDNHILTRLSGQEDRHEVSPALKLLFSAEDVSQLSAVYRQLRETPAAEA